MEQTEQEDSEKVRSDVDFKTNVLFQVEVVKGGRFSLNFTAPQNLGTFVVRAYAASGTGVFGNQETKVVVRRKLSLVPSVPRFVRVGDRFKAGAVITASGLSSESVIFQVTISGPVKIIGDSKIEVKLGPDQQEEAQFEFQSTAVGEAVFTFLVTDRHGSKDALEVTVLIEAIQEGVVVGTSFILQASLNGSTSSEGLDLPQALPGSGQITITSGVGQEPVLISLTKQLQDSDPLIHCPYDYSVVLAHTFIPSILDPYDRWNATENNTELSKTLQKVLALFTKAADLLTDSMTKHSLGLISFLPCPEYDYTMRNILPSLYINAHATWIFNELKTQFSTHSIKVR